MVRRVRRGRARCAAARERRPSSLPPAWTRHASSAPAPLTTAPPRPWWRQGCCGRSPRRRASSGSSASRRNSSTSCRCCAPPPLAPVSHPRRTPACGRRTPWPAHACSPTCIAGVDAAAELGPVSPGDVRADQRERPEGPHPAPRPASPHCLRTSSRHPECQVGATSTLGDAANFTFVRPSSANTSEAAYCAATCPPPDVHSDPAAYDKCYTACRQKHARGFQVRRRPCPRSFSAARGRRRPCSSVQLHACRRCPRVSSSRRLSLLLRL